MATKASAHATAITTYGVGGGDRRAQLTISAFMAVITGEVGKSQAKTGTEYCALGRRTNADGTHGSGY